MNMPLSPKHIVLYADDDPDDLMLVREAFLNYSNNVKVITAKDGHEALFYLENLEKPDPLPCLIILDVNMPRLNGKETLSKIREMERFKEVPVILFTTSSLQTDKVYAAKLGAGLITKPLDIRQMDKIADQFIEHCTDEVKKNIRKQIN